MNLSQAPSAKRQAPSRPLLSLVRILLLVLASGCGPKAPSGLSAGNVALTIAGATDPDNLTYDAGRVIGGETVTHDFSITNSGNSPVVIQTDDDIRLGCGCASLVPEKRKLDPGLRTRVTVTVRTQGFSGPLDKGGSIIWTDPNGKRRVVQMTILGQVIPPLRAEPGAIRLELEESRGDDFKGIWFREALPLDWSSFSLTSSSPNIVVCVAHRERQAIGCAVQCRIPEGLETFSATVTAKAKIADPSSSLRGMEVSLEVPVTARQRVVLTITPRSVPVTFRSPDGFGMAHLLLRGTLLDAGKLALKSVRCEGFQVEWKLNRGAATKAAVLEIVLKPRGQTLKPHPEIEIEVEGKGIVRLPIVAMKTAPM